MAQRNAALSVPVDDWRVLREGAFHVLGLFPPHQTCPVAAVLLSFQKRQQAACVPVMVFVKLKPSVAVSPPERTAQFSYPSFNPKACSDFLGSVTAR